MADWKDKITKAESVEELNKIKLCLFQENTRLENEKKHLKKERILFEQQLAVLRDGFSKLDADRQSLEREKQQFVRERLAQSAGSGEIVRYPVQQIAEALFRNTDNPLALQKRYKDLVKIFHPDNLFGDAELAQQINREYAKRKRHSR